MYQCDIYLPTSLTFSPVLPRLSLTHFSPSIVRPARPRANSLGSSLSILKPVRTVRVPIETPIVPIDCQGFHRESCSHRDCQGSHRNCQGSHRDCQGSHRDCQGSHKRMSGSRVPIATVRFASRLSRI